MAMRTLRRLGPKRDDNFAIITQDNLLGLWNTISSRIFQVLIGIVSISLVVGGIVIMNIMLVSVTERTREIGIRKAVGARRSDIVVQFLTEAVVLTGLGGLLGMTLGWLTSLIFRLVFPSLPTSVPLWSAALGVCVSVGVGLFFGTWPAMKAARLDPVVALQYE
jgi:putative ABC transport system permease protein